MNVHTLSQILLAFKLLLNSCCSPKLLMLMTVFYRISFIWEQKIKDICLFVQEEQLLLELPTTWRKKMSLINRCYLPNNVILCLCHENIFLLYTLDLY